MYKSQKQKFRQRQDLDVGMAVSKMTETRFRGATVPARQVVKGLHK